MTSQATGQTINFTQWFHEATAREVYGKELVNLGKQNKDVVVMTADLMRSNKTGEFKDMFPDRFFNFGIAEQNMMTAAAGMAIAGKIPFVSTFAAFASMRACEQVRTDIAYPNLNVRIVATHAGFTANGGNTHNAMEDIAIMRSIANMTIINPGDPNQVGKVLQASADHNGPIYIRIGRGMEPVVYTEDYEYEIGKAITVKDGMDATIVGTGITVAYALEAANRLAEEGINVRVIDMHTIKPLDTEIIMKSAKETGIIVTAEEHNIIGGLGGAVAECLAEEGTFVKFKRLGIQDTFVSIGPPEQLHAKYGFDSEAIYNQVKNML